MAFFERAYNERDKSESGQFAQEYVYYFLEDEPSPGIAYEFQLAQSLVPGISLDDVTALGRSRLAAPSIVVLATCPQKPGLTVPSDQDLLGALSSAERVALMPWTEDAVARDLVEAKPNPSAVTSRRELPDLGVTIVAFANGVEAWLKPTDFKNDQIVFTLYAKGGTSLASQAEFFDASFATRYIGLSGYAGIKAVDLGKMLAGQIAAASPSIGHSTHGISGSAAPGNLETALQLLYQEFRAPNGDPEAFALMQRQLEAALANRGQSPGQVFAERLAQVNSSSHYTSTPLTPEIVATLDPAKMLAFYRRLFANAADFTFFMVGAFEVEQTLPLLATYVGTLPSAGAPSSIVKDLGVSFPQGVVRESVAKGREPRSQTVISFFADPGGDPAEQERIIAATSVLDTILRDQLREDLGQTYTVSTRLYQLLPQRGDGHVEVAFGAAPENIGGMIDRVLQAIRQLQQDGPSEDLTAKARESARRGYETALKQNNYWLGRLQTVHLLGRDPAEIVTRPARIDAITPAALRDAFRRYFPLDRYTVVTLVPES
jgi:zinc protease